MLHMGRSLFLFMALLGHAIAFFNVHQFRRAAVTEHQIWDEFRRRMQQLERETMSHFDGLLGTHFHHRQHVPPVHTRPPLPTTLEPPREILPVLPPAVHQPETLEEYDTGAFFPLDSFVRPQQQPSSPAGFGGLFQALGFPGPASFPQPWWQGPNVCVNREDKEDDEQTLDKTDNASKSPNQFSVSSSATSLVVGTGTNGQELHTRFSSCEQTPSKYICTTV